MHLAIEEPPSIQSHAAGTKKQRMLAALLDPNAIDAELCRRDLYHFMQHFWPIASEDEFKGNWHIEYLCDELMKVARRVGVGLPKEADLVINVPPGSTKSITATIMFPDWCWLNWPWMQFITCSYSAALSRRHAEFSREIVRSRSFGEIFPEYQIKEDQNRVSDFRIQKWEQDEKGELIDRGGGNRFSTSVGGTVTGMHGHFIIVDDPIDPQHAVSQGELDTTNRWLDLTLSQRKADREVTVVVYIMQRLAQDDPCGSKLARKAIETKHICLPGEIRHYGHVVQPPELKEKYIDDLLDPSRLSWKSLGEAEEVLGQYGYAGQIGQDPTPVGGGMFKVDRFQIAENLTEPLFGVRYWDKAGTPEEERTGGAYTVGAKIYKTRSDKYVVADIKRGRWSSEIREKIIRETAEADGPSVNVWTEQEGGSGGKESAQATIRNLAGFVAHADRVSNQGDKVRRADPYSVQVNNGNVLLLRADWNREFIEEHRFFPFGRFKDQVDATAGGFNKLTGKKLAQVLTRR